MLRVAVTGANGFVGRAVLAELHRRGHRIVACVRDRNSAANMAADDVVLTGPLERVPDLTPAFAGVDAVVHTANWSGAASPRATPDYIDALNIRATAALGQAAVRSNVGQLVFVSSIKAMGRPAGSAPFTVEVTGAPPVVPGDAYGLSKRDAERALQATNGLCSTIIRPPLLYGPHVKGSMLTLYKLALRGVPLPLGSVRNARDLLAVQSLADLIVTCLERPGAANRTFLARDGEPVSTPELFRRVASSLGRPAHLWPFPVSALRLAADLTGRQEMAASLLSSLVIDDTETRVRLGWAPHVTMQDALGATAQWFQQGAIL